MTSTPTQPSLLWRTGSTVAFGATSILCRSFLLGLNNTETVGLDKFLEVLDARKDVEKRNRGLLTVSNHISVIDDPLMWGVLPIKYAINPTNHRWGLGSHDLCFTNKPMSIFFSLGQILPTHRSKHSKFGGIFQPTMTQAIRLLSAQPFVSSPNNITTSSSTSNLLDISDPFTTNQFIYSPTFSTNGTDSFPSPSYFQSRRYSWVHVFPEGFIHQHPQNAMRYFKWGVSRLILESEPLPAIIPIFINGNQNIMHENRTFPRFVPRPGKKVTVVFGDEVDGEKVFGDLRKRWQRLVGLQKEALRRKGVAEEVVEQELAIGELTEGLKFDKEAVELRKETARRLRMEVLKVRRSMGFPDEDPKQGRVETWVEEGKTGKREGKMEDGSWVKEA